MAGSEDRTSREIECFYGVCCHGNSKENQEAVTM